MQYQFMVISCPKCGKTIQDDSVYCSYCGHGLKPSAKTIQVSAGGTLLIIAAVASFIFFALSVKALATIYNWYPPETAQAWTPYNQLIAVFTFAGLVFGFLAGLLSLARKDYGRTVLLSVLCTVSGLGTFVASIITPSSNVVFSFFYFFLPLFLPAAVGTVLIYPRRAEFGK